MARVSSARLRSISASVKRGYGSAPESATARTWVKGAGDRGDISPSSSSHLRQPLAHPVGHRRAGPVWLVRAAVVAVRITEELAPRRPLGLPAGLLPRDQAVELPGDI